MTDLLAILRLVDDLRNALTETMNQNGNPAGTPGAKVDLSRLDASPWPQEAEPATVRVARADLLPPPFDSQEEAQRAAGIWPAPRPTTGHADAIPKSSALDEMAEQVRHWNCRTEDADPKDAIATVLDERGKRYGKFADHARITQDLKDVMRACPKWEALTPSQKEALEMVVHKVGRILNGDPNYDDSWVDVAGYSKLVADELQGAAR